MKQALLIVMVFLIPILSSIYRIESAQNNLNNARHGRFEDDYYRYTAVGIFSICKDGINNNVNNNNDNNNNYETPWTKNRTKFSEKAALSNRTIYMLTKHWKIYTDYISFDVCYNKSLLIEKLIYISLISNIFAKAILSITTEKKILMAALRIISMLLFCSLMSQMICLV